MEVSSHDDDDLKIQRASIDAIVLIKRGIKELLACFDVEVNREDGQHEAQRKKLVETIITMLDIFQEDPQLLDPHSKEFVPPLISHFGSSLDSLVTYLDSTIQDHLQDIANILYTFCKVRGEKVLLRFLDNEPKHFTPLLFALKHISTPSLSSNEITDTSSSEDLHPRTALHDPHQVQDVWKLRYILLIWAGHLILTPFDLQSMSEHTDSVDFQIYGLDLSGLPNIAKQLLTVSKRYMNSPTKERSSAASMLSKLALRPDIVKYGLLKSLIQWALQLLCSKTDASYDEQVRLFALEFIYGLIRTANVHDISHYMVSIYRTVYGAFGDSVKSDLDARHSAVSKKFSIKILRGVIVQTLQIAGSSNAASQLVYEKLMIQMGILEEVIDFLLSALADRDTQVRNAASKALSMITLKLGNEMAQEVVEAVIDSLNEDVLNGHGSGNLRDLSAVNPLRWHGLTLTLSYMLFRRSPSPDQLESILNAQYMTLSFEQRSATGNSLGTNVRDAANFGLWSLARRYTTAELLRVPTAVFSNGLETLEGISKIQATANRLICSACLDPSGNVRRGSSAALQELIGRHPDTVESGIALVQVVDYQAVGLRKRAMVDISLRAARLGNIYLFELLEALLGWQGLTAPDTISRNFAAKAVGQLISILSTPHRIFFFNKILSLLRALTRVEAEAIHGFAKALSEIVLQRCLTTQDFSLSKMEQDSESENFLQLWSLFDNIFRFSEKQLTTPSLRPELITETVVALVFSLSSFLLTEEKTASEGINPQIDAYKGPTSSSLEMLTLSLQSMDAATLERIPEACTAVSMILTPSQRADLVRTWLKTLEHKVQSRRRVGIMLALASVWPSLTQHGENDTDTQKMLDIQKVALDAIFAVYEIDDVDAKVASIRSLALIAHKFDHSDERLFEVLYRGLNDYTTNERGDVGSLVRLEAIHVLSLIAPALSDDYSESMQLCALSVRRLALERLDKVRLQAALCLRRLCPKFRLRPDSVRDVSTFEYFSELSIFMLLEPVPLSNVGSKAAVQPKEIETLLEGLAVSASAGSDDISGVARSSFAAILDSLTIHHNPAHNHDEGAHGAQFKTERLPSLLDISNGLVRAIKANLSNDRVLLPLLDLTVFLFDAGMMQRLYRPTPSLDNADYSAAGDKSLTPTVPSGKPRTLLSLVQKSHYKSSNLPKLLTCVQIYRHLTELPDSDTRAETLKKLCSMLGHPFPKIRTHVAEVLWVVTGEKELKGVDWTGNSATRVPSEGTRIARLLI